jgi:hypothetical protein
MHHKPIPAVMAFLILLPPIALCADLTKIERAIRKEPAYRSKPRYCLLVFGPEAKTRVWLVQDGNTIYVDRNGSGDLTEAGKKVVAEKDEAGDESYTFKVGDIHDGPRLHKELTIFVTKIDRFADQDDAIKSLLAQSPDARGYYLLVETELPGWKGTGTDGRVQQRAYYSDNRGVLQFAEKPQQAPLIYFGGPWEIKLWGSHRLTIDRETDIVLGVGTPGIGPGTTAWIDYEGVIPLNVFPTLDITYPPRHPGEPPLVAHYELKRRC